MIQPNRNTAWTTAFVLILGGEASLPGVLAADSTANLRDGVMLCGDSASECYDPVSYFTASKPEKGRPEFTAEGDGLKFRFSSEAHRIEFLKNPRRYMPAYEGWCATAVANGDKVKIDPLNFKVTDGRLFLFYPKSFFADARKKWVEDEAVQTKRADQNWPKVRLSRE